MRAAFIRAALPVQGMPTLPSAVVGGLADDNFWSSSQNDNNANNAWNQNFNNGNQNNNNKDNNNRVRPVRGFRRDRIVRAESGLGRKRLSGSARLASRGLGNQQLELFGIRPPLPGPLGHIDVAEVFEAYRECRRNKRSTRAALVTIC